MDLYGVWSNFLPCHTNTMEHIYVRNNKYFVTAKEFRDIIDEFFTQPHPKKGTTLERKINNNFQILVSSA